MHRQLLLLGLLGLLVLPWPAGCKSVRPWERGTLAAMDERCSETSGEVAQRRQWSATHEGATGAEGASPVGCGCK